MAPANKYEEGWWRRKTTMEKILLLLIISATIIIIALIAALCKAHNNNNQDADQKPFAESLTGHEVTVVDTVTGTSTQICMTPGCVHTASKILENMDPNVKPCDDFYKFACGKFLRNTIIPDDKTSVDTFSVSTDTLQIQIRALLEDPVKPDEIKPFKMAKNLYKACMNKALTESRGIQPLLKALRSLGGWPVLDGPNWDESAFSWQKSVKNFRKKGYGTKYLFDFDIGSDFIDTLTRIIAIDQASLGLTREYILKGINDPIVIAYYNYMVDLAVILGAPRRRAVTELRESLLFEISLANISLSNEERKDLNKLYNKRTITELQTLTPSISWLDYINAMLPSGVTVGPDEVIIVSSPKYLQDLERLLNKTPKRVLSNYLMWRVTHSSAFFMNSEVRKRLQEYTAAVVGTTTQEPTWKECTDNVLGNFDIAVGSLYVRKHFNEDSKKNVLEMVQGIRAAFINILENVDWMDRDTRKTAINKAQTMPTYIAYPDELLDNNKLEEHYNGLEVDENQFLESVLNLIIFTKNKDFGKLRKPVDKSEWQAHATPADVNAGYSPQENSIIFPAGILQGHFFSIDRPRYMNYGAVGYIIGHEITHGFDDEGRQFAADGNLVDWWAPATSEAYLEKAKCIIEQYGNYTVEELKMNVNGIITQGENIADNGGIKEAYMAYKKWVADNGEEPQLPGLKYTPNQMFWISAANTWCSTNRPEALKMDMLTDNHSPGEFRVLGPFSNLEEFAKDFQCDLGTRMNPHHKCKVW